MVASSQATTDSDPDASPTSPDPLTATNTTLARPNKHTGLKALVSWLDNGQTRSLDGNGKSHLEFDLHYNASDKTAYFKLRAEVMLKDSGNSKPTPLYVFIAPERIHELSLSNNHGMALGPDTVCLRFELRRPAALIGPCQSPVWKNRASGDVGDCLRSLACANRFEVCCQLPRREMPQLQLASMCNAASSYQLTSTPRQGHLATLYRGKGGKLINGSHAHPDVVDRSNIAPNDSPPAYDETEPGPPMPSALPGKHHNTSKKRRRGSSDTGLQKMLYDPKDVLEAVMAQFNARVEEMEATIAELKASRAEIAAELGRVKVELQVTKKELSDVKVALPELANELREQYGGLEKQVDELSDTVDQRVDDRVDEKCDDMKADIYEYIDEEIRGDQVRETIQNIIANGRVSFDCQI
ncbi:uncharacterized protein BCR38DRAFT_75110 [Pseudomassariella vexata]|uniref:Uncharacterized protein n=1 Tax=Pseudomassariella vexata TaxID=1141098 RepID=A0A1Y2DH24_9PEZI|nr:uncharacterized protein BCR38DRAFT_75110 [Pseudomassariella vexata]ORY58025.1 hypothetical protein BCR38DRAFT_75110 [Pseudomassariella vexata]